MADEQKKGITDFKTGDNATDKVHDALVREAQEQELDTAMNPSRHRRRPKVNEPLPGSSPGFGFRRGKVANDEHQL